MVACPPLLLAVVACPGWAFSYCGIYFFLPLKKPVLQFGNHFKTITTWFWWTSYSAKCKSCPAALQYFRLRHLELTPECKKPF